MTQITRDIRQALAGKVHCAACRAPMVRLGPDYACPTLVNPNRFSCPDNTINADRLLSLVVTQVIAAVMTRPVIEKVTGIIQDEAAESSGRLQRQLDQTELSLSELNKLEADLLAQQSPVGEELPNLSEELNDISNKRAALSYEARNSRREIDAQTFVSDVDRIRANATDMETFLGKATEEITNDFVDIFVESLGVGTGSIELTYMFPIPSEEYPEGRTTDVIPRLESDQTGVLRTGEPPDSPMTPHAVRMPNRNI